jgi:hypothetical protein
LFNPEILEIQVVFASPEEPGQWEERSLFNLTTGPYLGKDLFPTLMQ